MYFQAHQRAVAAVNLDKTTNYWELKENALVTENRKRLFLFQCLAAKGR